VEQSAIEEFVNNFVIGVIAAGDMVLLHSLHHTVHIFEYNKVLPTTGKIRLLPAISY
jgi:hypothetical protein